MDPHSSTASLVCSEMIGREQDLQNLQAVLAQASAGQPHFVWLAGEAGLGKTTLCRAFVEMSQSKQAVVLYGQAIPQDQVLPFGLFLDLFRRSFDLSSGIVTPFDRAFQSAFSFLWEFSPELAALFPEITPPVLDRMSAPAQRQQVVFHSVLRGLQALTQTCQGPLVLLLEDVHWADETSLELLTFLTQRLGSSLPRPNRSLPLLVLGTYRPEALPDAPALSQMLSQVHPVRATRIFSLTPLNASEHQRCVESIFHQPIPETFSHFLFTWDEGNPFFLEELLSAMVATGQIQAQSTGWELPTGMKPSLPSSLTLAILERFRRLALADQEVIAYAAVIGRAFDFALLAVLCGMNEQDLIQVLQRAVRAQLIHEVGSLQTMGSTGTVREHYQFRHALTREAIYASMLHAERRLRHQMVAETVDKLFGEEGSEAFPAISSLDSATQLLAEHYSLAGLADRAYPYILQEADRADRVCAFREECYYLDMAQTSLPEESLERLRLLERLALVCSGLYDFPAALRWLSLAREGYLRLGQASQSLHAQAAMLLPAWLLASSALPQILADIGQGIEQALADSDTSRRDVNLLEAAVFLSMCQVNFCQHQRILDWAERNEALYHQVTDPRKVAVIQFGKIARIWALAHRETTTIDGWLEEARQILVLGHRLHLPDLLMAGYPTLLMLLIYWGRIEEADSIAQETIEHENRYGTLRTGFMIGWKYFYAGRDWTHGIDFLRKNLELWQTKHIPGLMAKEGMALAHLLVARHELSEARAYLESAQPILEGLEENMSLVWLYWGWAKWHVAREEPLPAALAYEQARACWKTGEDRLYILTILLDGIEFYARTDQLHQAESWLKDLQKTVQDTCNPVARAALLEAQAAVKNPPAALDTLRAATAIWESLHYRYQYAMAAQRLAELLLRMSEAKTVGRNMRQQMRQEAETCLHDALAVYEDLGITTGKEAVHALRVRTRLEAQHKRRQTLGTGQQLTRRELEVLCLLTAGRSNREIAQELYLSIDTVENHIGHILSKLHCENRTQAALYAIKQGWCDR